MWKKIGTFITTLIFIFVMPWIGMYFQNQKQRKENTFPAPLFDYILKNGSAKVQFKIFSISRKFGQIIQRHREEGVDRLHISLTTFTPKNKIMLFKQQNENPVYAEYDPDGFIKKIKNIKVKNRLNIQSQRLDVLSLDIIKSIILKIQFSNLKFVCLCKCKLDKEILKHFMIPSITDFHVKDSQVINYDTPLNAFKFLDSVEKIVIPWQRNVTSMGSLMDIERTTKFVLCSITGITETIDAETTQQFINKFMAQGGYLSLAFAHFT